MLFSEITNSDFPYEFSSGEYLYNYSTTMWNLSKCKLKY